MSSSYKTLKYLCPVELGEVADQDHVQEGVEMDNALDSAGRLLANLFANSTYELLANWERVYGLTPEYGASTGVRVDALVAKIRARGGLSRPYFINLAASMGYEINIEEAEEFMSGWAGAYDELTHEDIIYIWQVNVLDADYPAYYFYAGENGCQDRLFDFPQSDLETIFEELKPADTLVFFIYSF